MIEQIFRATCDICEKKEDFIHQKLFIDSALLRINDSCAPEGWEYLRFKLICDEHKKELFIDGKALTT